MHDLILIQDICDCRDKL